MADRIRSFESDVFDRVEGRFDLIIFDPPFRWFRPRDMREAATTDENYEALTRFMAEATNYLNDAGRILLNFGTSGVTPDAARTLGVPVGTMKSRVFRGRRLLAQHLGNQNTI